MTLLTPVSAFAFLESRPDVEVWLRDDGTDHLKYAYRVQFTSEPRREMAIVRQSTNDGVTVYLNKRSRTGDALEIEGLGRRFPGVKGKYEYPKGLVGRTGDKGISAAAGSCPSLLPLSNDVLRVACSDLEGFAQLVNWYAGLVVHPPKPGLSSLERPVSSPPASAQALQTSEASGANGAPGGSPTQDWGAAGETDAKEDLGKSVSDEDGGAGRLADPAQRRAVERHSVEMAIAAYKERGYEVEERGKPFDLLCTPGVGCPVGTPVVHVEVKGSVSQAATVHLTKNEIEDARKAGNAWRSDLYIVSGIELFADGAGGWLATGGVAEIHVGWLPAEEDLTATDFLYRVPR